MTQEYELIIEADTNDADYVTRHEIVTEEQLAELKPLFSKVKKFSKNWANGDHLQPDTDPEVIYKGILTRDEVNLMEEYIPFGEYGIHSLNSIKYYPYEKCTVIL